MQIENNLTLLNRILDKGEYVVFSADGVWGVSCSALQPKAVSALIHQAKQAGNYLSEILVSDLQMLKDFATDLHPRIETLLVYHERPLRIKCGMEKLITSGLNGQDSYFRIVKDKAARILINEISYPIFCVSFLEKDNQTQVDLKGIRIDKFENIKFIASEAEDIESAIIPLIKVSFDEEGLIDVL